MTRPGLSGPLADPDEIAARVAAELGPVVRERAGQIFDNADARWPIRTGRSKAGLYLRDESSGSVIVLRIGNSVQYARFIKSVKVGAEKGPSYRPVLTRELGDPVRRAQRELPAEAAGIVSIVLESLK